MKDAINFKLTILTADKMLRSYQAQIRQLAMPVIRKVKKLLPFKESLDIVVSCYHAPDSQFATSGRTFTKNLVYIYTDPSQKKYKKLLLIQMSKVIAHELHHAARMQSVSSGQTLGEAIIFEGLAAHFESEVMGGKPSNFYTQFSNKTLASLLKKAKFEWNNKEYNYQDWFFGNKKRKIPRHAGYGLGYYLIGKIIGKNKASVLVLKPKISLSSLLS